MAEEGLTRVCSLSGHESRVWFAAWRPRADPVQLATCGEDRIVRFWGPRKGDLSMTEAWIALGEMDATETHSRTIRQLAWSADGEILAATSFDATVSLWKEASREDNDAPQNGLCFQCAGVVTGHENEVKSAAFSPSGEYLATCSRDKSVWIYETGRSFEYDVVAMLQSHTQDVKMVRWHPTQDILFSCSYDDTIKVWGPDGDDWSCKETLQGHEGTVWAMSFDSTGSSFISCSADGMIKVFSPGAQDTKASRVSMHFVSPLFRTNLAAEGAAASAPVNAEGPWRCVATIQGFHHRPIYSVDWCPFGTLLSEVTIASACGDNRIRVFQPQAQASLSEWSCVADVEAHDGDANVVAWCPRALPDGSALLASAGDDGNVVLWRCTA